MTDLLYRIGVALGIGFLIGLQREFASGRDAADGQLTPQFAGVRTFTLLGLAGATAAYVGDLLGSAWGFMGVLILVGGLLVASYWTTAREGQVGMTTEVAAVLVFLTGALSYYDRVPVAVAIGVVVMLVLSLKVELHHLAKRLTHEDLIAVVKFGVITAIILPVLPDRGLGPAPFDVLNPRHVWVMVILISGLSFLGYALSKLVGPRHSLGLTGLLGGMASSTAVTLTMAQRSADARTEPLSRALGAAVIAAWAVMFVRVLIEVAIVNRPLLAHVAVPLTMAAAAAAGYGFLAYRQAAGQVGGPPPDSGNPLALGSAIKFGLLYALILLVARIAQQALGDSGVMVSAALAGMADVDAITLTMAQLSQAGQIEAGTAGSAVTLATLTNTIVKTGIVVIAGGPGLRKAVLPGFLIIVLAGAVGVMVA